MLFNTLKTKDNLDYQDSSRTKVALRKVWGFTLIEMIVYVVVLASVFVLVVNTLLVVTRSYSSVKITNDLNNSSLIFFDRVIREIRRAESIDLAQSVFGSSPGRLVLNTTDSLDDPLVLDFYVDNGNLKLDKDAVLSGSLTSDTVTITNLVFTDTSTTTSASVKIELTLEATNGGTTRTENFYSSAVLRGSY
jgi:type II secretory pathway component PulJ